MTAPYSPRKGDHVEWEAFGRTRDGEVIGMSVHVRLDDGRMATVDADILRPTNTKTVNREIR